MTTSARMTVRFEESKMRDRIMVEAEMSLKLDSAVGERLKFGEFELAPVARTLWRRGEQVRLGSRALDILIALASRPGQILSKDDLTKLIWRGAFVDETALRVGISAVRKALGTGGDRYIATVPGRGYCFVLDVETTPAKPAPEPPQIARLKPQRLPAQIARVVGRDEVIATVAAEGTRRRLLSLVGPGGIGKTTVAVAVADRLRTAFDAVAFVDLAPIENGTQIAAAAAVALGLNLRLQEDPVDEIAVAVEDRRVLIVLDNCEHLVDLAAAFVEALLSRASGVTILATSRERLRAAGEWVHQVSPLEAPPESPTMSAEEVRGYPAVELFEERAAFARGATKSATQMRLMSPRSAGGWMVSPWQSSWPPGGWRGSACKRSPTHLRIVSRSSPAGDAQLCRATKRCGPRSTGATGSCRPKTKRR
jgi:DNA-binding winged helix-turn-helix (wHTH) protein